MWLPTIIDHQKMSRHTQPMVEGPFFFIHVQGGF
jgi:hypothetical protein